ncbi:NAD-dependent epimerase/dehydratase family protein [Acidimangrovimonas pyrenivorans]|uniref:NAD-dependent epimerase/dehydratase family protein n=1 Tax=Acidimangrovimonas pyrenivorans TaxID=2030798 RepID=A0ABV7ACP0_9RHOB
MTGRAAAEIRVLVTGGSGRLGRMLRAAWSRQPPPGLRPLWQGRGTEAGLRWDILDAPWPEAAPAPRVVLHLAGVVPGPGARLADNTALALAVCRMAAKQGAAHVFLSSSGAVYGPTPKGAASEEDPVAPANDYGRAKFEMEQAALDWRRAAGPGAPGLTMLRIGNVAGADALLAPARDALVLDDFPGRPGGPLRSYIGPETLARLLAGLARQAAAGATLPERLNIAAPHPVALADLARAAGLGVTLRPAPAGAVPRVVLDTARLQALLPVAEGDSDPEEMVAQWRRIGGRNA